MNSEQFFPFKRGDIVDAYGDAAVILDVLRSEHTDDVCVYVRFVRNIGDSRPFDTLSISPSQPRGANEWKLVSKEHLLERIKARQQYIAQEIKDLLNLA